MTTVTFFVLENATWAIHPRTEYAVYEILCNYVALYRFGFATMTVSTAITQADDDHENICAEILAACWDKSQLCPSFLGQSWFSVLTLGHCQEVEYYLHRNVLPSVAKDSQCSSWPDNGLKKLHLINRVRHWQTMRAGNGGPYIKLLLLPAPMIFCHVI